MSESTIADRRNQISNIVTTITAGLIAFGLVALSVCVWLLTAR
jgi:hypothetical protein